MTNKEYREHEGISKSQLYILTKSPQHFKYAMEHPEEKDSPALLFGRACHKYILEKEEFDKEFVVAPNIDRRTKAGKEEYALFEMSVDGREIISADDMAKIIEMSNAIDNIPIARRFLKGKYEQSFFWTDERTGEMCKCRPDCLTKIGNLNVIVDYKTCENAETTAFMKDSIKHGYDLQAGMYSEGMEILTGEPHAFVFVAQEKKPPYAVNVIQADKYFMAEGNDLFHSLLELYHECKTTDNWYGLMGENNEVGNLTLYGSSLKEYEAKIGVEENE